MAYKINGTTVVDNSRNVCACCVTSCCITASSRMDAPSGNTASRPSSPATGSIYFDTDEGALVSYNGTEWVKGGSGFTATEMTPVSDWIGPYFMCCTSSTSSSGCLYHCADTFWHFNAHTCQLMFGGLSCDTDRCGYVKYLTFTPSNCGVTFNCCSCPCCCGCNGFVRPPNFSSCCGCVLRVWGYQGGNLFAHFRDKSVFPAFCCCLHAGVLSCGTACDFCWCCVSMTQYCYSICNGPARCFNFLRCFCRMIVTDDRCCVSWVEGMCFCCCAGTATTGYTNVWIRFGGSLPATTICCYDPIPLVKGDGTFSCGFTACAIHHFCNGLLYWLQAGTTTMCWAYMFMCNNGTAVNIMLPCSDGSTRCWFITCEYSLYPTEIYSNGAFRIGSDYFGHEIFAQRSSCAPSVYYSIFKHTFGDTCFDANAQCVNMAKESGISLCTNKNAGMFCFGHCVATCDEFRKLTSGFGINETQIRNVNARWFYCNNTLCNLLNRQSPSTLFFCDCKDKTPHNCSITTSSCIFYLPTGGASAPTPIMSVAAIKEQDPNFSIGDCLLNEPFIHSKYPSDYACFTAKGCDHKYGPLPSYGVAPNANTCDMQLFCWVCSNMTPYGDASKLWVAISCLCKQCCLPPSTTAICKCAVYVRLYCG